MPDPYDTSFRLAHRLRDIVVPDGVSWWPPALAWWILAGLLLLLSLTIVLLARFRFARRREALHELGDLLTRYKTGGDTRALLAGLSILLRRVAIARDGRRRVAALHGGRWLEHLDRRNGGGMFSDGAGALLASLPYMPPRAIEEHITPEQIVEVVRRARRWIRENT